MQQDITKYYYGTTSSGTTSSGTTSSGTTSTGTKMAIVCGQLLVLLQKQTDELISMTKVGAQGVGGRGEGGDRGTDGHTVGKDRFFTAVGSGSAQ